MTGRATDRLAVDGGRKAVKTLPQHSKLGAEELMAIINLWELSPARRKKIAAILKGQKDLRGPHLFRYYNPRPSAVVAAEKTFARKIGVKHALAVNSCTSALIAALKALGIGAGDEVIVPAYTFFATAATVGAANAIPVIAEVDDSLTLDPKAVERAITRRTKAIAVVHMRGVPAQMDQLMRVARKHGLPVIEDVAQACGGSFGGKRLGAIGTIGCFSFDFYKIIVSGEGGFVTTNDAWLFTRAQSWHDTAACWRPDRFARERKEGELFCGENYRMSELQGAVAKVQIGKLDRLLRAYRKSKSRILEAIEPRPGLAHQRVPDPKGDAGIDLIMFLPTPQIAKQAVAAMQAEGVPAGSIYDKTVRDWHIYTNWEHVLERKAVAADGLPWSAVPAKQLPKYSPDMCPRTLDLLSRSIHVNTEAFYTAKDCAAIARGINKVLRAYLA